MQKKWGYEGLIITDALEMGALTSTTWDKESAIRAVEAGSDIILLPLDGTRAISSLIKAVEDGRISKERIEYSYNKRTVTEKAKQFMENQIQKISSNNKNLYS